MPGEQKNVASLADRDPGIMIVLCRKVAIKVLPAKFASDRQRLARFESPGLRWCR